MLENENKNLETDLAKPSKEYRNDQSFYLKCFASSAEISLFCKTHQQLGLVVQ